jgi:hypothetical protein
MARKKVADLSVDSETAFDIEISNKYECQLDILPPMIVEANTEQDAIDNYHKMFGVISSEIRTNVKRL